MNFKQERSRTTWRYRKTWQSCSSV